VCQHTNWKVIHCEFKLKKRCSITTVQKIALLQAPSTPCQHTFKLELTQVLPQLDGPPEDRIMLTKKSTQPPPFSSKAANPIVYDVYDQDVADTLKSRDRSTLVIQPPRPLDAEYYGVSDCRQAFCKKLYYVPPPAAAGTLWEALVQHCDKAQDLLACSWAKGDHTTSKEFFVMMVQAVLWPVVFEEADVHALFNQLKDHDKDELLHTELKDRLATCAPALSPWALALKPAHDPIPKADMDFCFQEGYAQVSVVVRLTEPWRPPPARHAHAMLSPGGAASGSERGESQ